MGRRPSTGSTASASRGRSWSTSWCCSARVAVETTTGPSTSSAGRQVGQRLAGARAGLHQQVLAVADRLLDRRGHLPAGPGRARRRAPRRPRRRGSWSAAAAWRYAVRAVSRARYPSPPTTVPARHRDGTSVDHPLRVCGVADHAERDGPGDLPQVRRHGPPRLPGPPARQDDLGIWLGVTERHRVGLPRPAVGGADPVRAAGPAPRLVDRHVQPAAADQRGLLRHRHARPGGRATPST